MKNTEHTTKFWTLETEQVLEVLHSSRQGLSVIDVEKHRLEYGKNILLRKKSKGALSVLGAQFASPLIFILLFAGCVTLYLGEYIESIVIFLAVFINIIFGFYQEYKAENTIEKLASYVKNTARVIRNGSIKEVNAEELVIGDIISVEYGSRIPADARIIESTSLRIDEAILTGESLPAEKTSNSISIDGVSDRSNYVFTGTYAVSGAGLAVVTHIGNNTEIGKIAASVAQVKRVLTPVQTAVKQMSWYIFLIALVIVAGVFILGIVRGESIWDMLILSSAVAVGAVPEALPITLTVILSVGVLSISKKGGLIRKLSAAETLGSTTLVLTDKTGTLTFAELSMDEVYTLEDLLNQKLPDSTVLSKESLTSDKIQMLQQAMANTSGVVEKIGDDPTKWIYSGSAFDRILLKSVYQFSIPINSGNKTELIVPFNSTNKFSIADIGNNLSILGAPDILIKQSSLSQGEKDLLLNHLQELSNQGKRLIALGEKPKQQGSEELDISGVKLIGLFAFSDPLRPDSAESLKFIQAHGIAVKIITGDMPGTARYIANQVGLTVADNEILTGEQIKNMDDTDLKAILPTIKLFARVTPEDKLRIGNLYRSMGEIVAMTGDGVNDSPALKAMDIGISLASGSDVAKSAADMILLDNNFKTITETITEGYKIRSNIQKVFVYLMSSSLDEVFVIAGALIAGLALPMNALQIIWVNILTGTLPALAFAYEHNYSVHKKSKKIFDFKLKFLALGIGTLSSILLFVLYYGLLKMTNDVLLARSIFFACFATYVLSVSYSFRDMDKILFSYNPFTNMRLNIAAIIGFGLVFLTIYHPFMQSVFSLTSVPASLLWIIVVWNVFNVLVVELAKFGLIKLKK
jgi:Ca2+-transporting ATPase